MLPNKGIFIDCYCQIFFEEFIVLGFVMYRKAKRKSGKTVIPKFSVGIQKYGCNIFKQLILSLTRQWYTQVQ